MSKHHSALFGWLLLTPAAIVLIAFTHWPALATILQSFFSKSTALKPSKFIGGQNYINLFHDPVFIQSVINNILFALGTVVPAVALAMVMAMWVNGKIAGRDFLRLSYFTPTILPMVAAANIWLFFYTPEIGMINKILSAFGMSGENWLGDPKLVLPSIIIMTIWKEAGFFMVFYLAGLQTIPSELKEAARLEGTGKWKFFWEITFPLLMPTTLFVVINAVLNSFKRVDQLFILTKGGPNNASNLILYYIYETAFSFFDESYAATITAFMLLILVILVLIKLRLFEERIHYQ
jgi:sn-glycerol 3-phosphate transport system permease protein